MSRHNLTECLNDSIEPLTRRESTNTEQDPSSGKTVLELKFPDIHRSKTLGVGSI